MTSYSMSLVEFVNFFILDGEIDSAKDLIAVHNASFNENCSPSTYTLCSRLGQRYSIEFRSGEEDGQTANRSSLDPIEARNVLVIRTDIARAFLYQNMNWRRSSKGSSSSQGSRTNSNSSQYDYRTYFNSIRNFNKTYDLSPIIPSHIITLHAVIWIAGCICLLGGRTPSPIWQGRQVSLGSHQWKKLDSRWLSYIF